MEQNAYAFSGFSVNDLSTAKDFYVNVLELDVEESPMGLHLKLNGTDVFVYQKDDHKPASFTVLNFAVKDIDAVVASLRNKGVTFEHYDGMTGNDGVARGLISKQGPDIAWFKDPAGNIFSVLQNE